jgi:hypothetical protein
MYCNNSCCEMIGIVRLQDTVFHAFVFAVRQQLTGFMDFVHRLEFQILENTTFRISGLFPSSGEERGTHTLLNR